MGKNTKIKTKYISGESKGICHHCKYTFESHELTFHHMIPRRLYTAVDNLHLRGRVPDILIKDNYSFIGTVLCRKCHDKIEDLYTTTIFPLQFAARIKSYKQKLKKSGNSKIEEKIESFSRMVNITSQQLLSSSWVDLLAIATNRYIYIFNAFLENKI